MTTPTAAPGGETTGSEIEQLRAELDRQQDAVANLRLALESNRSIGTALGLIMSEFRLGTDAAFELLVRLSQNENRKVNALAGELVASHCAGLTAVGKAVDPPSHGTDDTATGHTTAA